MAVLCLLTNTPWPWPTPAGAASARGGFPTRNGVEGERSESLHKRTGVPDGRTLPVRVVKRGRLGCLLRAPGTESLSGFGYLAGRGEQEMLCGELRGVPAGMGRARRHALWRLERGKALLPFTCSRLCYLF